MIFQQISFKIIFLYMEIESGWLRNIPGYIWKSFRSWKQSQKSNLRPKTEFSIFGETSFFSFRQKLTFGVTNLEIYPVEYVHMDHTDHLGFRSNFILICKFPSSFHFLGKSHFLRLSWKWINSLEVYSESSPMLGTARRGFCFWKTNISGIFGHAHLGKT